MVQLFHQTKPTEPFEHNNLHKVMKLQKKPTKQKCSIWRKKREKDEYTDQGRVVVVGLGFRFREGFERETTPSHSHHVLLLLHLHLLLINRHQPVDFLSFRIGVRRTLHREFHRESIDGSRILGQGFQFKTLICRVVLWKRREKLDFDWANRWGKARYQ